MKVLFIDSKILSGEKLLELISCEKKKITSFNNTQGITLYDSPFSKEKLLKDLEVSKDMVDELVKLDGNLVIILNTGDRVKAINNQLNFDFKNSGNLNYKDFSIKLGQEEVYISGKRVKLTALEYKLLLFFVYNVKRIIPRETIIDYLWGRNDKHLALEVTMYTHIKNLKKKLIKSGAGNFIHSVYGQGYKFEDPEEVVL